MFLNSSRKFVYFFLFFYVIFLTFSFSISKKSKGKGCLKCHYGIENIRQPDSKMMNEILKIDRFVNDPGGCTVCHGGNPSAKIKSVAHSGNFYPDPGSSWINVKTCGTCHKEKVKNQWRSLMMTEAGKIQGAVWSVGGLTGYKALWANYDVKNPSDSNSRLGTSEYRKYKEELKKIEPQAFPDYQKALPDAPKNFENIDKKPSSAVFTYLREECERCHLGVKGRNVRGDYRGMGCSACHIPYSNEGFYEGKDRTISKNQPGHMLIHTIQSTRDARITIHNHIYSGIPVETCTTCHDRGKRIGVSFEGLMETPYCSPWGNNGKGQPKLHTKHYISMESDIHYRKYHMLCQDCHTTLDVHGDGFLTGTTLASVEIECTDCHGTPTSYPWELPTGYGDEFGRKLSQKPRGVTKELLPFQKFGTVYPPEDGYILTSRGNPFGNVVRRGNKVVVHTAGGRDLVLKPLKLLAKSDELNLEGRVAMVSVNMHIKKMECYSCHAQWAPQCYGCHVKIDYSNKNSGYDWLKAGHFHSLPEHRKDAWYEMGKEFLIPGKVSESRSYLRWEDPILGINGEGRVTPLIPGCQVNYTIIDSKGKVIVKDKIFRTPPNMEGGGVKGQLSIDMAPVQPHTNGKARSCESCHVSKKAAGYGIGGGRGIGKWNKGRVVDISSSDSILLTINAITQIEAIPGLMGDWSRIVTENGKQLQTVGHHFKLSRPLNNFERGFLERKGLCLGCHQEIPENSAAVNLLHHIALVTGKIPDTPEKHTSLLHKILLSAAWAQILALFIIPIVVFIFIILWRRRGRK